MIENYKSYISNLIRIPFLVFKGLFDFRGQKLLIRFNIIIPIILLLIIGMIALSSKSNLSNFYDTNFYKQLIWVIFGIALFIVSQYIRLQYLYDYSYIFYLILVFILVITYYFGVDPEKTGGARSWLQIGNFRGQPSEFGKILFICFFSRILADINIKSKIGFYFPMMAISISIPLLLLLMQPDLGTAIAYVSILVPLMYWSGIRTIILFFLLSPIISMFAIFNLFLFTIWMIIFVIILFYSFQRESIKILQCLSIGAINIFSAAMTNTLWGLFKPHQQERILTFLDPLRDPFGAGWQVIQSRISIGSGGFWGKGWKNGTQAENNFLPVSDSDFILSTLAEEFGFFIILLIVIILFYFIYWSLIYAQKVNNKFYSLLIIGFSTMIFMHMIINLGMISGLLPVTGLPAPFISYGGSFLLTCLIMVGLINNIINNHI